MNPIDKHIFIALQEYQQMLKQVDYGNYLVVERIMPGLRIILQRRFTNQVAIKNMIDGIQFNEMPGTRTNKIKHWNCNLARLISVVEMMILELKLDEENKNNKQVSHTREALIIIVLIILSLGVWYIDSIFTWNWLALHPKRIAILGSVQVILFTSTVIIWRRNARLTIVEAIGILGPMVLGVLSIIQ